MPRSGVLAEQVNPYTNEPISVSPLTWSHATVVSTAIKYLEKLEQCRPAKRAITDLPPAPPRPGRGQIAGALSIGWKPSSRE